jgi:hypothetical protein
VIKLLLNPSLQLATDDAVHLVSEIDSYSFPLHAERLLRQLQSPTDIDEIASDDLAYLQQLADQRLLVNANFNELPREVAAYWLAKHYHPGYVKSQLAMPIQFVGPLGGRYGERFAARYPECTVVDGGGRLQVYVTRDLRHCEIDDELTAPMVLIKVGGIKQSIGPVLSPNCRYGDLRAAIARPSDVDLSVTVPDSVQATADHILLSELYHLRVQAGMHMASNHVVEWHMGRLVKNFFKVKP